MVIVNVYICGNTQASDPYVNRECLGPMVSKIKKRKQITDLLSISVFIILHFFPFFAPIILSTYMAMT
jgi:hypothetical protein